MDNVIGKGFNIGQKNTHGSNPRKMPAKPTGTPQRTGDSIAIDFNQEPVVKDKPATGKKAANKKNVAPLNKNPQSRTGNNVPQSIALIDEQKPVKTTKPAERIGKAAGDEMKEFSIQEGLSDNRFLQGDGLTVHVMLTSGCQSRAYVSFPSANSGIAFRFDRDKPDRDDLTVGYSSKPEKVETDDGSQAVKFGLTTNRESLTISDFLMDTIRTIRDLKEPEAAKQRVEDKKEFVKSAGLPEEGYVHPKVGFEKTEQGSRLSFHRKSMSGKNNYHACIELSDDVEVTFPKADKTAEKLTACSPIVLKAKSGKPIGFTMTASVDYKPLTPYKDGELLNDKAVKFREKLEKTDKTGAKRFDEAVRGLRFLSSREKFMAGSWRFLTYFGRDTMMSLMMLKDVVKPQVYESAMQSVIDRTSPEGAVAHEEDVGSQAEAHRMKDYVKLKSKGRDKQAEDVRKRLSEPVYDYKMVDDDFMLPLMLDKYNEDASIPLPQKRAFYDSPNVKGGRNIEAVLQNFEYALGRAEKYTKTENPRDLIKINEGEHVGDWRDSNAGLGWGKYPGSVNVDFVANAMTAMKNMAKSGIYSQNQLHQIAADKGLKRLQGALSSPEQLDEGVKKWTDARKHFLVKMPPDKVRAKLKDFIDNAPMPRAEKARVMNTEIGEKTTVRDFVEKGKTPENLKDGLEFYALSLDNDGKPVEVMNSDGGFRLFNGNPESKEIDRILKTIELPYPLGLAEKGGLLTASPVFASDKSLRKTLDRNAYHGTLVWSWQMALMEKGLEKQIKRFAKEPGRKKMVKRMYGALSKLKKMEKEAGELINSELWTHKMMNGKMKPYPYGADASSETESNPVQLWSTVGPSTAMGFAEATEMMKK